jgi:chromosome transmission fidelity protein 18
MPFISSPVTYPASSSPAPAEAPRKKRKLDGLRSPLKPVNANSRLGGFIDESSDEEDELPTDPKRKLPAGKPPSAGSAAATFRVTNADSPKQSGVLDFSKDTTATDAGVNLTKRPGEEHQSNLGVPLLGPKSSSFRMPKPIELSSSEPPAKPASQPSIVLVNTYRGKSVYVGERRPAANNSYEQLVASRSTVGEGNARKSYYGIDMHQLIDESATEDRIKSLQNPPSVRAQPSIEEPQEAASSKRSRTLMWTEKYRARKFTDLVGDERTHRSVLRWLKAWDTIVFPGSARPKPKASKANNDDNVDEPRPHRKILMLTGPPGLGKTTLAHVCARQAGYEVQEINASDERSRDVVKGRIRDMVGTENVRGVDAKTEDGKLGRKAGKPVCVVVDEVDGVVGGSGGGGEGGFVKALIDLVMLDQKNSNRNANSEDSTKRKKKGDRFRLMRPLILICNDVYHPSLRPLRQSSMAEIIHIRRPPFNMVVSRVHSIFEKEGVPADTDAVRRLCEATWGVSNRKQDAGSSGGTAEGDIRSVMVIGEWVATKFRASTLLESSTCPRLTRRWVEDNMLNDLGPGGGASRSLGRGSAREVVERVFQEGAGFPKTLFSTTQKKAGDLEATGIIGVAEAAKRRAIDRLRDMINTSGDTERIMAGKPQSPPFKNMN